MAANQRNLLLGALVVVLIAGAGYFFLGSGSSGGIPSQFTAKAVCLACQQNQDATESATQTFPLKCSKCSKPAVYPWYYCYACKKRFVPAPVSTAPGRSPGVPIAPTCLACGSDNVGAYVPTMTSQQPVGDAPLPKVP